MKLEELLPGFGGGDVIPVQIGFIPVDAIENNDGDIDLQRSVGH